MVTNDILEQIGRQSKRAYFVYNLAEKRFEVISEAAGRIWSKGLQELQTNPHALLDAIVKEEKKIVAKYWEKLMAGKPVDEIICLEQNGQNTHLRVDAYPVRDAAGKMVAVAGLVEDVTRHRQFVNYLVEFGHRKNSMLEMVSHDLQGPLAIVKSVSGLLRHEARENRHEEIEHFTKIIEDACTACTDLIGDLLSEEHLRSPEVYVNKTLVNLSEKIQLVVDSYRLGPLVSQEIELNLPAEPLMAEVDAIKFSQILNNLISNSIKFTPPEGKIKISARQQGEQVVLEHRDNGIGIPKDLQPVLFDRYTKAGRKGLRGEESRGLGMSIVRELVKLQGGDIRVESRENEGATFYITLPQRDL